jgi:hypothetical protein
MGKRQRQHSKLAFLPVLLIKKPNTEHEIFHSFLEILKDVNFMKDKKQNKTKLKDCSKLKETRET